MSPVQDAVSPVPAAVFPAQRVVSVMPPTAVPHDVLLAEPGYHARSKQFVMDLGHATVYDSAQQLSDMTAQGLAQSFPVKTHVLSLQR